MGTSEAMGWFGLFDLVRLDAGDASGPDWPLPNTSLRLADPHLAALYHSVISECGQGFQPDLYDIASHYLARTRMGGAGRMHVDMRMTGRPASMLFGAEGGPSILSWHAPTGTGLLRLEGGLAPVVLERIDLASLLAETLEVEQIPTISASVGDADGVEQVMRLLDRLLTTETRAILRMPVVALPVALQRMKSWPARCAAVLPCGGGKAVTDVLLCFEDLSAQTPLAASARVRPRPGPLAASLWNDGDRGWRAVAQGGVVPHLPRTFGPVGFGPIVLVGAAPSGAGSAILQPSAQDDVERIETLLDIAAAVVVPGDGSLFVVPVSGPVVRVPLQPGGGEPIARRPIRRVAERITFLLGPGPGRHMERLRYVTEFWPTLEYLFQFCDRERVALSEIDVLLPGGGDPWILESLALAGIPARQVRTEIDGVLFRRLLVASPASCDAHRSTAFDQFWTRCAARPRQSGFVSFSRGRPSGRVLLLDDDGRLLNGADLAAIARDHGYEVIAPVGRSLDELAGVFATARCVVGTADLLGWTCLARQCEVGLLQAGSDPRLPHAAMHAAAACGHRVSVLFGTAIGDGRRFAVAPGAFAGLLDQLDAAPGVVGSMMGSGAKSA